MFAIKLFFNRTAFFTTRAFSPQEAFFYNNKPFLTNELFFTTRTFLQEQQIFTRTTSYHISFFYHYNISFNTQKKTTSTFFYNSKFSFITTLFLPKLFLKQNKNFIYNRNIFYHNFFTTTFPITIITFFTRAACFYHKNNFYLSQQPFFHKNFLLPTQLSYQKHNFLSHFSYHKHNLFTIKTFLFSTT